MEGASRSCRASTQAAAGRRPGEPSDGFTSSQHLILLRQLGIGLAPAWVRGHETHALNPVPSEEWWKLKVA